MDRYKLIRNLLKKYSTTGEKKTVRERDRIRVEVVSKLNKLGMEVAMEYEKRTGWSPFDVSNYKLGFDIISRKD